MRSPLSFHPLVIALAALALLVASAVPASAGRHESGRLFSGFDPARVPRRPAGAPAPVARMLDSYITRDSLGGPAASERDQVDRLTGRIAGPILREYAVVEQIEPTPGEVDTFVLAYMRAGGPDAMSLSEDDREAARGMVQAWKVNRSLYRRYGGVVIYQQLDPLEPIGAYRALLEEMRKRKVFEIYDRDLADGFWARLADRSFEIPPDRVDFETPWWLRIPPEAGERGARAGTEASRGSVAATPPEGYTVTSGSVRFVFDPGRFEAATNGATGEWTSLRALPIQTVHLAGDFNGWSTSAWAMRPAGPTGSLYLLERSFAELGGAGTHEFKFVVNGVWWVEPGSDDSNQRETGLGNQSSNLEVVIP
jgi:hypothetical protein